MTPSDETAGEDDTGSDGNDGSAAVIEEIPPEQVFSTAGVTVRKRLDTDYDPEIPAIAYEVVVSDSNSRTVTIQDSMPGYIRDNTAADPDDDTQVVGFAPDQGECWERDSITQITFQREFTRQDDDEYVTYVGIRYHDVAQTAALVTPQVTVDGTVVPKDESTEAATAEEASPDADGPRITLDDSGGTGPGHTGKDAQRGKRTSEEATSEQTAGEKTGEQMAEKSAETSHVDTGSDAEATAVSGTDASDTDTGGGGGTDTTTEGDTGASTSDDPNDGETPPPPGMDSNTSTTAHQSPEPPEASAPGSAVESSDGRPSSSDQERADTSGAPTANGATSTANPSAGMHEQVAGDVEASADRAEHAAEEAREAANVAQDATDAAIQAADDVEMLVDQDSTEGSPAAVEQLIAALQAADETQVATIRDQLDVNTPDESQLAHVNHIASKLSEMEAYVKKMRTFIDENGDTREMLETVQDHQQELRADIDGVATDVDTVTTEVDQLEAQLEDTAATVEGDVETLGVNLETLEADLEELNSELTTLQTTVEEISEEVKTVRQLRSALGGDVGESTSDGDDAA